MKNVMLIDVESVRKLGYVHKNVLPDTIQTTIVRVQQTMLRKVMGKSRYDALLVKVSLSLPPTNPTIPLDTQTKELIEDYIQPFLVACVDYRIIYPLTIRMRSKSVGKGTDENHTPSDVAELIKLKDQMRVDVDSYREDLVDKLAENDDCMAKGQRSTTPTNSIKFR
jgi:hypothetical protein